MEAMYIHDTLQEPDEFLPGERVRVVGPAEDGWVLYEYRTAENERRVLVGLADGTEIHLQPTSLERK